MKRALRDIPDEVLLLQVWAAVRTVVGTASTDAAALEGQRLLREVNRRGLGGALLPAGRAMRAAL